MEESGPARDTDFHGYGPSIRARLAELIPGDEDLKVLDIGTGMGHTARFLTEHLSEKSHLWSVDPSMEVIQQAASEIPPSHRKKVEFIQRSADDLRFRARRFDLIVSVMVMHHIENAEKSIAEMSRVLRKGGRLIIIDYSPDAHALDFRNRHAEKDFFTSHALSEASKAAKLKPLVEDHKMWYLVEASKL